MSIVDPLTNTVIPSSLYSNKELPFSFPATHWYKWFAWHPVNVKGKKVWLRYIYRTKRLRVLGIQNVRQVWVYGDIFDVLKA